MTYTRSISDSAVMVGSTANYSGPPVTNGVESKDAAMEPKTRWKAANSDPVEGEETVNGRAVERDGSETSSASSGQLTDSPPPTNGATIANPGGSPPVCQNCGTSTTPLWRRNELGATLCNACGLFLKLHGRARPMNLKTDTIKSRNRMKSVQHPKKKVPRVP
jgi:GATA-binding protein, other eukaryote